MADLQHMKTMLQHFEEALGGNPEQLLGLQATREEVVSVSEMVTQRTEKIANDEGAGTELLTFKIGDSTPPPVPMSPPPIDDDEGEEERIVSVMTKTAEEETVTKCIPQTMTENTFQQVTATKPSTSVKYAAPPVPDEEPKTQRRTVSTDSSTASVGSWHPQPSTGGDVMPFDELSSDDECVEVIFMQIFR